MSRDLNDTLMFVKVVEQGTFTAAARALAVPKATLSRKVRLLEERLGTRLLKRTTRRLGLTEAGALYYERGARIARDLEDAESAVNQLNGSPRGWLRVTTPYLFAEEVISPLLPEFMAAYPEVRVEMLLSNEVVDLVGSELDLAIRAGPLGDSTLVARRLASLTSYVYASTEYLARHGEPREPADLEAHRALCFTKQRRGSRFYWSLTGPGRAVEAPVTPVLVANEPSSISRALLSGLGLALTSDAIVDPAVDAGCLRHILVPWSGPALEINAVFPPGRMHAPKVRAFVDFLIERLDVDRLSMRGSDACA